MFNQRTIYSVMLVAVFPDGHAEWSILHSFQAGHIGSMVERLRREGQRQEALGAFCWIKQGWAVDGEWGSPRSHAASEAGNRSDQGSIGSPAIGSDAGRMRASARAPGVADMSGMVPPLHLTGGGLSP